MISLMTSGGIALWVAVLSTPFLIRWLIKNNIGQQIREDGPQVHIAKAGTPTMGGICIVAAVLIGFLSAHIIPGVNFSRSGALVMLAIVPLYALNFRYFMGQIRQTSQVIRDKMDVIFGHLKEKLDGVLVIKAHATEATERYERAARWGRDRATG